MQEAEKQALLEKVDKILDDIRPHLAVDGGDVEVVDVSEDMTLSIKWLGNCEMCTMSAMTLRAGIEQAIKTNAPEIQNVKALNGVGAV